MGVYRGGGGSSLSLIHSNFYPTVADLISRGKQQRVVNFLRTKPLNCNVYGAQFIWDALYKLDEGDKAMELLLSKDTRSYYNMIQVMKSTTASETWDRLDLTRSHPRGAAGGKLIVGSMMGIHALEPGFAKIGVKPQTSDLEEGKVSYMSIRGNRHVNKLNENANTP